MPPPFSLAGTVAHPVSVLDNIGAISTLQDFQAQRPALLQAITDLKSHVTEADTQVNDLNATITTQGTQLAALTSERDTLKQDNLAKQALIDRLQAAAAAQTSQTAKPLDLANAFQGVIDTIQQQARSSGSSTGSVIKSLDVELKGLVTMQADASSRDAGPAPVFTLPQAGSPVDPNQLSVMRLSFGAIPNVAAAAPPSASPPAPPAPPPQPTRRQAASPASAHKAPRGTSRTAKASKSRRTPRASPPAAASDPSAAPSLVVGPAAASGPARSVRKAPKTSKTRKARRARKAAPRKPRKG